MSNIKPIILRSQHEEIDAVCKEIEGLMELANQKHSFTEKTIDNLRKKANGEIDNLRKQSEVLYDKLYEIAKRDDLLPKDKDFILDEKTPVALKVKVNFQ